MPRRLVILQCHTDTCVNSCMLDEDGWLPAQWTCPACERDLLQQQLDDMERRLNTTNQESTQ